MKKLTVIVALAFLLVACKGDDSQLEERVLVLESQITRVEAFLGVQIEINENVSTTLLYQNEVNKEILLLFQDFHPGIGGY